ncbi:putative protein IDA [Dioscorea sansibarensis]
MGHQIKFIKVSWIVVLVLVMAKCCHGSRNSMQGFHLKPEAMRNPGYFFGFLPKAMPIPPSAPSKQHNSFGLDSSSSFFFFFLLVYPFLWSILCKNEIDTCF